MSRSGESQGQYGSAQDALDELINLMTIMYIAIQETLNDPGDMSSTYGKLCTSGVNGCTLHTQVSDWI